MTKIKEYNINTFKKLMNVVNTENVTRFSADFFLFLDYSTRVVEKMRKDDPLGTKDKTNYEVLKTTLHWIDDGKNKLNKLRLIDENTGEIHEFNLEK